MTECFVCLCCRAGERSAECARRRCTSRSGWRRVASRSTRSASNAPAARCPSSQYSLPSCFQDIISACPHPLASDLSMHWPYWLSKQCLRAVPVSFRKRSGEWVGKLGVDKVYRSQTLSVLLTCSQHELPVGLLNSELLTTPRPHFFFFF